MKIISHRGMWHTADEKNSLEALRRSIASGFGTETDVRDMAGRLVVAHDPAVGACSDWSEVVELFESSGLPLAVNVKSDGLATWLAEAFGGRTIDWFAFDMSCPQMVQFANACLPFYTRHSDVERVPMLYNNARGVWLDGFYIDWFEAEDVLEHCRNGKSVCIVSPELHGRLADPVWQRLIRLPPDIDVTLCTDEPQRAKDFFHR